MMDDITLQRLRPEATTTAAIAEAMVRVTDETFKMQGRLEELRAERPALLLSGTTAALRQHSAAISESESDLEQLQAIGKELDRQYKLAADAEAAGERQKQFEAAASAIEASNAWFKRNYLRHARALAEGLQLEQNALNLVQALQRDRRGVPAGLPQMARAFVGSEGRSFSYLTKLPGAEPGQAIHWQAKQTDSLAHYYAGRPV
jgi:hypothetical protein